MLIAASGAQVFAQATKDAVTGICVTPVHGVSDRVRVFHIRKARIEACTVRGADRLARTIDRLTTPGHARHDDVPTAEMMGLPARPQTWCAIPCGARHADRDPVDRLLAKRVPMDIRQLFICHKQALWDLYLNRSDTGESDVVDFPKQEYRVDKAVARAALFGHHDAPVADAQREDVIALYGPRGAGRRHGMLALGRLLIIGFVVLTIIYVSLSFYSRAVRRGKLEAEWEEAGMTGDKDAFVREGLEEYDGSLRRKLILGVYVVPLCLVTLVIYLTNFH